MSMDDLPPIVRTVLARNRMVAIREDQYEALLRRPEHGECRFPLFPKKFGPDHAKYLGTILQNDDDPFSGLHVVECVACGHITFEHPIALASPDA